MTEGEYKVGISFNPGAHTEVDAIKAKAAELIDLIGEAGNADVPEVARLRALATDAIESGAMWGVKAATKRPKGV